FALLQLMQSTMGTNHVNEGKLYPYEHNFIIATRHRMRWLKGLWAKQTAGKIQN
ncbi:hypothetical protein ACJX0J_032999, partial [Zea mays]